MFTTTPPRNLLSYEIAEYASRSNLRFDGFFRGADSNAMSSCAQSLEPVTEESMSRDLYAFGYGSLLHPGTLPEDRNFAGKASWLFSHRRSFCFPFFAEGITLLALGIYWTGNPRDRINGVTYRTDQIGIDYLLERESGYRQVVVWPRDEFNNEDRCEAFMHERKERGFVALSYVLTAYTGFKVQFGQSAAMEFMGTTEFEYQTIVDDAHEPLYDRTPKCVAREYDVVINYLKKIGVRIINKKGARRCSSPARALAT